MLPASLRQRLIEQAAAVEGRWQKDVRRGGGFAPVPDPLEHKRPRRPRIAVAILVPIHGAAP